MSPHLSRRDILRGGLALGAGAFAVAHGFDALAESLAAAKLDKVPKRAFGKSGREVSVLTLGTMFDTLSNQLLLRRAVELGVTCWDTAAMYEGGDSEKGLGKYFHRNPQHRDEVFLITKSRERDPAAMGRELEASLKSLRTDRVDLYYIHAVGETRELRDELVRAGEKWKAAGKIRLFGFSTHSNVDELLLTAPSLGWVDGILHTYNLANMDETKMEAAVAACHRAGIGLSAMKLSRVDYDPANPAHSKRMKPHLDAGFSEAQARLRVALDDPRIATAAVTLKNTELLETNAVAAMGRPKL